MSDVKSNLETLRIDRAARQRPRGGPWLVALVALAGAAAAGWWWMGRADTAAVRSVAVTERLAGETSTVLNASGYVTARRRATVSSKITGRILEVFVEEGMPVQEGQTLARLDDAVARGNLALAEAQLEAARKTVAESEVRLREAQLTLDRRRQLVTEGILGQADLDAAQAELDSLVARIALAREQVEVAARQLALRRTELDDTIVRAPFGGVAISKDAQPGEMVSPISAGGGFTRTGISTIVDMSSLEIEVEVNESYINRVQPAQAVTARLDAYPDWPIPARVITTVPAADRQKATVMVRIAFEQLDPRILPDMGIKVAFHREEETSAAGTSRLLVPRSAVRVLEGRDVVFVLKSGDGGTRVERRAVQLGAADGDQVEVAAGLTAGERVVVEGPASLADGEYVVDRSP